MNSRTPKFLFAILILGIALMAIASQRYAKTPEKVYTGYVVAYNMYLAAPFAATIAEMPLVRGQTVDQGTLAFRLDTVILQEKANEARALIEESLAKIVLEEAALKKAQKNYQVFDTEAHLALSDKDRVMRLQKSNKGAISQSTLDSVMASSKSAAQKLEASGHDIIMMTENVRISKANHEQAKANLAIILKQLQDASPVVPTRARVDEVLYQVGEWVGPNIPVISLVPENQIRARFYVPEPEMQQFRVGTRVSIQANGSPSVQGTVDFIATRPEYTPPVIYSLSNRSDLVFLVEAVPEANHPLIVGQPLDVRSMQDSTP